uniref:Uncharacterized protein n=1 Tax=Arundo donax TaxID=35708 RepID=A0A0A9ESC2_ARUDO
MGGAQAVELANQPAARVLRNLPGQAPQGRGRRHPLGRRDRAEGAQLAGSWDWTICGGGVLP